MVSAEHIALAPPQSGHPTGLTLNQDLMGLSSSQDFKTLIQPIFLTRPEVQEPVSYRQEGRGQGQKEPSGTEAAFPLFSFNPLALQDEPKEPFPRRQTPGTVSASSTSPCLIPCHALTNGCPGASMWWALL